MTVNESTFLYVDAIFLWKNSLIASILFDCLQIKKTVVSLSPFFSEIDLAALAQKAIEPPYKPRVRDAFDVSNFEAMQSGELDVSPLIDVAEAEEIFANF